MQDEDSIKVKDYVIHQPPLGEGSYGRVYRATYRGISERALKIFRPGAVDLASMARELEKLSQVTGHQGIVALHDFDLLNDPPYYAMGLYAYQNLEGNWEARTLNQLCGKVDVREGWRLIRDIADALSYLHQNRIIHCDIKPSNILLSDEIPYHIKICDFGQSRGPVSEGTMPVGTPLYASPEQLRNPRDSADGKGFRWDVYSFGVVAYQLLTGELPRLKEFAASRKEFFDAEATFYEPEAETSPGDRGKAIDGNQIATLVEGREEISWPSDLRISSERKLLIADCLSIRADRRPSDMREVWARVQRLEQQDSVRAARKLNTVFAILLVIAIWASGFALVQARKASLATADAVGAADTSKQNANAAIDLMRLFVSELNKGDISGSGANRLYTIVAEYSQTFLDNRSKNSPASARILRFSGQTAALRGRQALARNDLDGALKDFTTAFEIRSKLAEDADTTEDYALLASRDLASIADIYERKGSYAQAVTYYNRALEWRTQSDSHDGVFSLAQLKQLAEVYRPLANVYVLNQEPKQAISTLEEILSIFLSRSEDEKTADRPGFVSETVRVLLQLGETLQASGNLSKAGERFQRAADLAKSLSGASPGIAEEAARSYLSAIHSLGLIQIAQKQPEAALALLREEIRIRDTDVSRRPYDAELKLSLADAYEAASRCLDFSQQASRSLAVDYLGKAINLLAQLPFDLRSRSDITEKVTRYQETLAKLEIPSN